MANHKIKYPKEYNPEIRTFETSDLVHANVLNGPLNTLINNEEYLKEQVDAANKEIDSHIVATDQHVTVAQKQNWDKKANNTLATDTTDGLLAAKNKVKLDGVADHAEVNQNAVATIKAGDTLVNANGKTAQINFVEGTNIAITGDNATKNITISAPTAIKNPQPLAIRLNGVTQPVYDGSTARTVNITPSSIRAATADHSHAANSITQDSNNCFVTDAEKNGWNKKAGTGVASIFVNGLMAAGDKVKLDGIAYDANNYTHPATHPANTITSGTFAATNISAAAGQDYTTARVRNIYFGTGDMVAGSTPMQNGAVYMMYE